MDKNNIDFLFVAIEKDYDSTYHESPESLKKDRFLFSIVVLYF